jgi:hypothetical protein
MATLTVKQVLERIRFDRQTKRGSVLDVVQLVTKCSQVSASRVFQRLSEHHPDLLASRVHFKFPGQGQRPTPVATVMTLCEIAWLLPGKNAAVFRREGASTLCRALGGDLTLIEEIRARHGDIGAEEQAILLEGTGVSVQEANGEVHQLELAERQLALAERRMKLALDSKLAEHTLLLGSLDVSERLKIFANGETDARFRMALLDASKNVVLLSVPGSGGTLAITGFTTTTGTDDTKPISVSSVAADLGKRLSTRELSEIGRVVAASYREAHDGESPPQHDGFANGHIVKINSYFEKDRALIADAIESY